MADFELYDYRNLEVSIFADWTKLCLQFVHDLVVYQTSWLRRRTNTPRTIKPTTTSYVH